MSEVPLYMKAGCLGCRALHVRVGGRQAWRVVGCRENAPCMGGGGGGMGVGGDGGGIILSSYTGLCP